MAEPAYAAGPRVGKAHPFAGIDWSLVVVWILALTIAGLVIQTFVQTPEGTPFSSTTNALRLVRATLTITLVLTLTVLLFSRLRRAQRSGLEARLLLELPVGALLLVDDGGIVRQANGYAEGLLSTPARALVGRHLSELFAAADRGAIAHGLTDAPTEGLGTKFEVRGLTGTGASVPLEVSVAATSILHRRSYGIYLRDLSEREALVGALADRAAELARSNRELEQFAYIASHDLQEPLRMVGSYTQLLGQRYSDKLDSDAKEFLAFAQEGALRMRQLIDDLLAFSRLGTRGEKFRPVAMERLLGIALTNLRGSLEESHAEVTHGPLPEVDGDASQLVQVLQNLIGNAIKFRGPTPPHIRVEAVRAGPDWEFTVHDDGIGISPAYQEKIFVIFQRLHTREEYPGSGIGLSVCKKVVERHGGRIWVESTGTPGQGTTFHFTLKVEHPPEIVIPAVSPARTLSDERAKAEARSLIEERLRALV